MHELYLDAFNEQTSAWEALTTAPLPRESRLLLFRENPENGSPEAVISWRNPFGIDTIGIVRRGASAPETIAVDSLFENILVSPDRTQVYGYVASGKFHRVASEKEPPEIAFWLDKLEEISGIEQVYFLADAKYAFVKTLNPEAGADIFVLERDGDAMKRAYTICSSASEIAWVEEGEHSFLFVPKEDTGGRLIVYLHDGPWASIDRRGDRLTDLLILSGNPVLAINYSGSLDRAPEVNVSGNLVDTFGEEVERAIAFAHERLGTKDREVVFVAHGFGSLVGSSAILSGRVSPAGFAIVSGFTSPREITVDLGPASSLARQLYYDRLFRQLGPMLRPQTLIANDADLRLRFILGRDYKNPPYEVVADFVRRFNTAKPATQAELTAIDDMLRYPVTKKDFETIIGVLNKLLSEP